MSGTNAAPLVPPAPVPPVPPASAATAQGGTYRPAAPVMGGVEQQ